MNKDDFLSISLWSPVKITRENIARKLRIVAQKYVSEKLVDLGCGTKPYEDIFKPFISSYVGVDFKPTSKSNYGENTKADVYADCTDTKLQSETFDTLISTQVLEHIYDTQKYARECYRLLKKGGFGIFTIPLLWQCHAEPYDYYRFTKYAIEKLFTSKGFEIVLLEPLEGAYAALIQTKIVSVYMRNISKRNILIRVYCKIRNYVLIPFLNLKGLYLDKIFWNDKLCLNYLLVVRK